MTDKFNWFDILKFWIDALEVSIPVPFITGQIIDNENFIKDDDWEPLIFNLVENSNTWYATFFNDDFVYKRYSFSWFHTCLEFCLENKSIPLFYIYVWDFNDIDTSRIYFTWEFFNFYLQGFISYSPLDFLEKYVKTYINRIKHCFQFCSLQSTTDFYNRCFSTDIHFKKNKWFFQIKRMDIALDLNCNKSDILPLFDKIDKYDSTLWEDSNEPLLNGTYNIGKDSRDNNRIEVVRIYNKLDDLRKSKKKGRAWKLKYYPNYQKYTNIQRIEIELRQWVCERLPFDVFTYLSDPKILWSLYLERMNKKSSYFAKQDKSLLPIPVNDRLAMPYWKMIPESYNQKIKGMLFTVFNDLSYHWLCLALLQPQFENSNIRSSSLWLNLKPKYIWQVRSYIDPLRFLDYFIKYLLIHMNYPYSKINKVLRNNYIKRDIKNPFPLTSRIPLKLLKEKVQDYTLFR